MQATLATMRTIKKALDPNNIMNPGKIFLEEAPVAATGTTIILRRHG